MTQKPIIRYKLDFQLLPILFHTDKKEFSKVFMEFPAELLAEMYTQVYETAFSGQPGQMPRIFSESDFSVRRKTYPGGAKICLVLLPPLTGEDGSHVYCTAYAMAVSGNFIQLYTIEKSVFGTTCIGTVDKDGNHINLGDAGKTVEENLTRIARMLGEEPAESVNMGNDADMDKDTVNISGVQDLIKELQQTIDSCASPPLVGKPEDNARWLMGRIRYFREMGIPEDALYILDMRIMKYMPDFVAGNFPEFLKFLNYDFTSITMAMEELMEKR